MLNKHLSGSLLLLMLCISVLSLQVRAGDIADKISNEDAGAPASCPSGVVDSGPSGPAPPSAGAHRGNPIHVASGNKYHKENVYLGAGEFPLEYSLYYNSRHITPTGLTGRWTASYSQRIQYDDDSFYENPSQEHRLALYREDGQVLYFTASRNQLISNELETFNPYDRSGELSFKASGASSGSFIYYRPDGFKESFSKDGLLTAIESPTGLKHTITRTYDAYDSYYAVMLGERLCSTFRTGSSYLSFYTPNTQPSGDVVSFTSGNSSQDGSHYCSARSQVRYANWECRRWSANASGSIVTCDIFAHRSAECLGYIRTGTSFGGGVETDRCSRFERIIDRESTKTLAFDAEVVVTDSFGNQIRFDVSRSGSGESPDLCDGCAKTFSAEGEPVFELKLNGERMLSEIHYLRAPTTTFKTFKYEIDDDRYSGGCNIRWNCTTALTGIVDEDGRRYATWDYLNSTQSLSNSIHHVGRAYKSYHGEESSKENYYEITYTDGHNRTVTNGLGRQQVLNFNAPGGHVRLDSAKGSGGTNCQDSTVDYNYNAAGQIIRITYSNKKTIDYTYYSSGQIESITEAKGTAVERSAYYIWHTSFVNRLSSVDYYDAGDLYKTIEFEYYLNGRLKSRSLVDRTNHTAPYSTYGQRSTTEYSYEYWDNDSIRVRQVIIDGPRTDVDDITRYVYDQQGRLIRRRIGMNYQIEYARYTDDGYPQYVRNHLTDQFSDLHYNWRNQIEHYRLEGRVFSFTYSKAGLLERVTLPEGEHYLYSYDQARILNEIRSGRYPAVSFDRYLDRDDPTLRVLEKRIRDRHDDPKAKETVEFRESQRADALGRTSQIRGDNKGWTYKYDELDALVETDNAGEFRTSYETDALGRRSVAVNSDFGVERYTYNAEDQITSITDPRGLVTTYTYDGLGNLIQIDSPDTGIHIYRYDRAGNRISEMDQNQILKEYEYDPINRLVGVTYPGALNQNVRIQWGVRGSNGRVAREYTVANHSAEVKIEHDVFQSVIGKTVTHVPTNRQFSIRYEDNRSGKKSSITYPSGRIVRYDRGESEVNSLGTVQEVSVQIDEGLESQRIATLSHYPFGPIRNLHFNNGRGRSTQLNGSYMPIRYSRASNQSSTIQYDDAGLIMEIDTKTRSSTVASKDSYLYDEGGRLSLAVNWLHDASGSSSLGWVDSFGYDQTGNRESHYYYRDGTPPFNSSEAYTIEAGSNRVKNIEGEPDFVYSNSGEFRVDPGASRIMNYNAENRMWFFSDSSGDQQVVANYEYSPFGDRVFKTVNGVITYFMYGRDGKLLAEMDANGNSIREYIYVGDLLVAMIAGSPNRPTGDIGEIYYVHTDHLGTPVQLTDNDGRLVWQADYFAFGDGIFDTDPDGDGKHVEMPIRFPGQYHDKESGLYYNYFRYYDPKLGRYTRSDPIGLDGGINTYAYANNNPLSFIDPFGLSPEDVSRLRELFNETVRDMTEKGERQRYLNNWRRNLERLANPFSNDLPPYDPEKWGHRLQCYEQTQRVIDEYWKIQGDLDDFWAFDQVHNAPLGSSSYRHSWGRARSANPNDPIIYFDPFYDTFDTY